MEKYCEHNRVDKEHLFRRLVEIRYMEMVGAGWNNANKDLDLDSPLQIESLKSPRGSLVFMYKARYMAQALGMIEQLQPVTGEKEEENYDDTVEEIQEEKKGEESSHYYEYICVDCGHPTIVDVKTALPAHMEEICLEAECINAALMRYAGFRRELLGGGIFTQWAMPYDLVTRYHVFASLVAEHLIDECDGMNASDQEVVYMHTPPQHQGDSQCAVKQTSFDGNDTVEKSEGKSVSLLEKKCSMEELI